MYYSGALDRHAEESAGVQASRPERSALSDGIDNRLARDVALRADRSDESVDMDSRRSATMSISLVERGSP
jgi:hypothetical protein